MLIVGIKLIYHEYIYIISIIPIIKQVLIYHYNIPRLLIILINHHYTSNQWFLFIYSIILYFTRPIYHYLIYELYYFTIILNMVHNRGKYGVLTQWVQILIIQILGLIY